MSSCLATLAPLVGVIIGGLITYFVTTNVERQRWRQQRQDKLDEAKRQAVTSALAWMEPMETALICSEMEVYSLINGTQDARKFRQRYPALLPELTKLDLTADQCLLLPQSLYPMGLKLCREIEELKSVAIELSERARVPSDPMTIVDAREECIQMVIGLKKQLKALRQTLEDIYLRTYFD